ncbi:ABC transporter permease [Thalassiella azotivora]
MATTTHARPVTAPAPGGPRGGGWRSAFEFWWRTYLRTWRGSVFTGFLSPLLYLAAMGYGLGALVDRGDAGGVLVAGEVVPYVLFVAPGVLAATAMQAAVGEATYPVMGAIKWQRQYHAMIASPLGVQDVALGHLAYLVVRVAITSAVFVAVAAALGAFASWWALLALPAAVLTGTAFAASVYAFATAQENDQGFNVLFRFVVTPMFLFSGTFFPVDQLPGWLQPVAWVTPLWHGVELCRSLTLGTVEVGPAALHVAYLLLWVAGGVAVALRCLGRRLVD